MSGDRKPLKIALVGCGKMGGRHGRVHRSLGHELVLIDADKRVAAVLADELEAQTLPVLEDALESVDAVDICTPTPSHCEQVLSALGADKPVLCEKPLCKDLAEAQAIQEAQTASAGFVMTGYLLRLHPAFETARRLVKEDILGGIHLVQMRIGGRGGHVAWKHSADRGGGVENEVLSHLLDLAVWMFGPISKAAMLFSDTLLRDRIIGGDVQKADAWDLIVARLRSVGGCTILAQADLLSPGYMNHLEIHGQYGSLFTSSVPQVSSILTLTRPRGGIPAGRKSREFAPIDLLTAQTKVFADAVAGAGPVTATLDESVQVQRLLESLKEPKRTSERSEIEHGTASSRP